MSSCYSVLECYSLLSEVKLSIRSVFVIFILNITYNSEHEVLIYKYIKMFHYNKWMHDQGKFGVTWKCLENQTKQVSDKTVTLFD